MKSKKITEMHALGRKIAVLLYELTESNPNGLRLRKIAKILGKKKETIESAINCKVNRHLFEKSQKDDKKRQLYRLTTVGKNCAKEHKENIAAQKATDPTTTSDPIPKPIIPSDTTQTNDQSAEGATPTNPA